VGLEVSVGVFFTGLLAEDDEYREELRSQFDAINVVLSRNGLPLHCEPEALRPERTYSGRIGSYGVLHALRRVAIHLALEGKVPPPLAPGEKAIDALLAGFCNGTLQSSERFEHLLNHSDAEGFYLPIRFERVLLPEPRDPLPGGPIGSSFMLLRECEDLARALGAPADGDEDGADEDLIDEDSCLPGFASELATARTLLRACRVSVASGAAALFH
jgi:hypothetical protein